MRGNIAYGPILIRPTVAGEGGGGEWYGSIWSGEERMENLRLGSGLWRIVCDKHCIKH
jgi:hypothetical protein